MMRKQPRSVAELLGDEPAPKKHGGGHVQDHRQKLVLEQAEHTRLKNAKMRGELLDAAKVEATWTAAVLDVRAAILAVPSRFGARHGISQALLVDLDADLRDALASLAGDSGASDG